MNIDIQVDERPDAHSPAVLQAYPGFAESLSAGRLTAAKREIVALAVGQANACQ